MIYHDMKACQLKSKNSRNRKKHYLRLYHSTVVHLIHSFLYLGVGAFWPISSFCLCNKNLFFFISYTIKWVHVIRENNIAIIAVQEKAREFATALGVSDFIASAGWLDRFQEARKPCLQGRFS